MVWGLNKTETAGELSKDGSLDKHFAQQASPSQEWKC
jgi:hypothetical protein